jgi:hypothetical protein
MKRSSKYRLPEHLRTGQMEQGLNFEYGISGYTPKLTNGENRINLTSQLELIEIIKLLLPCLICCNIDVITKLSTAFLHQQFLSVLLFSLHFAKLLTNSLGQIVIPKAQLRGALIERSKISHH